MADAWVVVAGESVLSEDDSGKRDVMAVRRLEMSWMQWLRPWPRSSGVLVMSISYSAGWAEACCCGGEMSWRRMRRTCGVADTGQLKPGCISEARVDSNFTLGKEKRVMARSKIHTYEEVKDAPHRPPT